MVDSAAPALVRARRGLLGDELLGLGRPRRGGARPRARRCASPTSACTRASAAVAPPSGARPPTCCCARSPSATPTSTATPATSRCSPRRPPRSLGLEHEDIEAVRQAAQLHDIGKVAIPEAILHKPGPLDDDEWAFMRRHSEIGERIIGEAPALARVAAMVRSSHERFDGTGYPDGLAGKDIPLGARIVAVCDAFDAMITERPYSAAHDARGGRARAARLRRQRSSTPSSSRRSARAAAPPRTCAPSPDAVRTPPRDVHARTTPKIWVFDARLRGSGAAVAKTPWRRTGRRKSPPPSRPWWWSTPRGPRARGAFPIQRPHWRRRAPG